MTPSKRPVRPEFARAPVALSVGGSDCSAGAGIQADLKAFLAHGCYGLTAVTCVVSETPGRVESLQPVRPALVGGQTRLLIDSYPVGAAKTGMLFSASIVRATAEAFRGSGIPLVVDPVMVASSGDPLLEQPALAAYRKLLFPLARVVTPNVDELALLTGKPVGGVRAMRDLGLALAQEFGCAFLLKGGHLGRKTAVDLLVHEEGMEHYEAPFVRGVSTHGTGCTYSAAIAANLALGHSLPESVARSKAYVTEAIRRSFRWGEMQALHHMAGFGG